MKERNERFGNARHDPPGRKRGKSDRGVRPEDAEDILGNPFLPRMDVMRLSSERSMKGANVIMETGIGGERFIEPPVGDPVRGCASEIQLRASNRS